MTPPTAATHDAAQPRAVAPRLPRLRSVTVSGTDLLGRRWAQIRFLVDAVVLYLASSAALFARGWSSSSSTSHAVAAAFPLLVLAILHARRAPDERISGSLLDTASNVLGVVSLAAMVMVAFESVLGDTHPLDFAVRLWLFSLIYLGAARIAMLSLRRRAVRSETFSTPTLIVGAGVVGDQLVKRLLGDSSYGLRPVGIIDSDPLTRRDHSASTFVPVLGGPEHLTSAIEQTGARQVILAFSSEPDHVLVEKVRDCQKLGVEVALVPRLYETINERATLDHVGGLPLVTLRPTDPRGWQFAVKHSIDRSFALVALIALAPLMALIAALVKLSSPGPIIFRQPRMGRDGREFTMLKFRTMRGDPASEGEADAEWAAEIRGERSVRALAPVDRTTWVGRLLRATSLDELPQFISVLRGDMSLVGPRPERVSYARMFIAEIDRYDDRHRVKSGITGWAQVNGLRGKTSIADRVEWDNWYIQNWSLRLDLRIIVLTIVEVFRLRG